MNIFKLTAEFESEESCRNHFKEERDKIGVICKKCSNITHYWIKANGVMNVKNVEAEPLYEAAQ